MAKPRNIELNKQLVQCWYSEDVLHVVSAHLKEFNLVNCTTALHRLAKSSGKQPPRLGKLETDLLQRTVELVRAAGYNCPAQNLANALWACEKLQVKDASLTDALVAAASEAVSDEWRLSSFSGQQLANVVWAAAKISGSRDFKPFAEAVRWRAVDLNAQELSMVAWALASTGEATAEDVEAVATAVQGLHGGGVRTLEAQQLATVAWALAKAACKDTALLEDIARYAPARVSAGEFNAQDLANTAWAFGRLECKAQELFSRISEAVKAKLGDGDTVSDRARASGAAPCFSPQQMSMLSWAFAKVGFKDAGMMLAIVRESTERLASFAPRDLTDIVWSLEQLQVRAPKFVNAAGQIAVGKLSNFNTQELMRFMGAFRRAGGDKATQSSMMAVQQKLSYDFPALPGAPTIVLLSETPGERLKPSERRKAKAKASPEDDGDPQRSDGRATGVALWEASFVLAEWLSRQKDGLSTAGEVLKSVPRHCIPKRWRGSVGVELGAGLGLPSIVSAHLGVRMVATDGDAAVLRLLSQNVVTNAPSSGSSGSSAKASSQLRAETLLWGTEAPLERLALARRPDLLLAADVVYASGTDEMTKSLISTMLELTGPSTLVIMGNVQRYPEGHPQGEGRFFKQLEADFESMVLPQHQLHADFQRSGAGSCKVRLLWRRASTAGAPLQMHVAAPKKKRKRAEEASVVAAEVGRLDKTRRKAPGRGVGVDTVDKKRKKAKKMTMATKKKNKACLGALAGPAACIDRSMAGALALPRKKRRSGPPSRPHEAPAAAEPRRPPRLAKAGARRQPTPEATSAEPPPARRRKKLRRAAI